MVITSTPVSSLNQAFWPHCCMLASQDVSSLDGTVSRNTVSTWLSLESSVTELEQHYALKWPFRWQRWHMVSFAGQLSRGCWLFRQRVHCFCGLELDFGLDFCQGLLPKPSPWVGLPLVWSSSRSLMSLLVPLRACCWLWTASRCWTISLGLSSIYSVSSCRSRKLAVLDTKDKSVPYRLISHRSVITINCQPVKFHDVLLC